MLSPAISVTPAHARRFMLRALGVTTPFPDVAAAIAHHGYVQLDPINVCGRMHDLILRNRVAGYREGDLLRYVHGEDAATPLRPIDSASDRTVAGVSDPGPASTRPATATHAKGTLPSDERRAFEHYVGVLAALPVEAWPFLVEEIRARAHRPRTWWGRLAAKEERLAQRILATIAARGPLSSDDVEHDDRSVTAWNSTARLAKVVLEKLFVHGRVLITTRRAFRRIYDLPERVLPARVLALPTPPVEETKRWRVLMKLRQRRLVKLSKPDVAVVAHLVQPVRIDGGAPVYCLRADAALWDEVAPSSGDGHGAAPPRLLAPLDPVIYDRALTRRVWDFDYTWEVYTPPAKRVRGYYALPVLAAETIAGHVDPKADREGGRLRVMSRRVKRGVRTAEAVSELARFLGLK